MADRAAGPWSGGTTVLTAADVPGLNAFSLDVPDQPVLAADRIRFHGEAVAVVAADTDRVARRATEAVVVDAEPMEVIADPLRALEPGCRRRRWAEPLP
ncbi:hypothetical protein [Nonomuraea wenchangensis]|uniref:hypothetical protein n=1 Tax=Nonomuraea wenchangensis TaxID=568860 RepID=UPI00343E031F